MRDIERYWGIYPSKQVKKIRREQAMEACLNWIKNLFERVVQC